ncbi:SpoIIE family protein phosphatase [Candidatus Poribacteria bacterium]
MLSIAEKIACLEKTELFRGMPGDALERIAGVAQEMHLADDETIFNDGDKGDAVYFVVEGEVKAHRFGIEITRIGKNNCVGEMGVIDEGPRSGSVSSIGNTLLLKVGRDDFYHIAQNDLKSLQNVLKIVLRKLRRETDREVEAMLERERMTQDLLRAREMQMNMLPTEDLHIETSGSLCLKASGNCYPAEKVGGDYYDYFRLPDNQVGLVIGDVMGHGFHTGLMVAMAKSLLQVQMKTDYSVPSVMSAMNDMVCGFMHGDYPLFMTFCYMIVDLQANTIYFSNAGHSYPYHYRVAAGQLDMLESDACPLGILADQDFETSQLEWEKDDIFVLYSDGIIEAENTNDEEFGEERLKRLIVENAQLPPAQLKETVLHELDNFCHGVVQADDVSLVAIKIGA